MAELGYLIGVCLIGALVIIGILTRLLNWILSKYNVSPKKIPAISAVSVAIFSIVTSSLIADLDTEKIGGAVVFYSVAAILWLVYDLKKTK